MLFKVRDNSLIIRKSAYHLFSLLISKRDFSSLQTRKTFGKILSGNYRFLIPVIRVTPHNYAYQSALKHGRRTFQYSAMGELVCSGQLWARVALIQFAVTRSDSESIFQQQFSEYHGYEGCYSIYFDSSTIVRLSGLL